MEQSEIVDGLRQERIALREFVFALAAESWERETLCEGWRVRDVVAHLAGNCADVIAGNLSGVGSTEYNQRQVDERASRSTDELVAEWDAAGPQVEALYAGLPAEMWDAELPAPLGTVGRGVMRQLEDLWVHAQDIRIPLDGVAVPGPGTRATLELAAAALGARFVRLTPSVSVVELDTGEFTARIDCAPRGDEITVSGGPVTVALVATGRVPLAVALEEGTIRVTPELPKGLADALNIYGP